MKFILSAAALLTGATLASVTPTAQASPGNQGLACIAKVIHSEELPFAPIGNWLVKVTVQVTPPNGNTYQTTLQDWMPWQGPPPRRGQAFRVHCDPANPRDLHLIPSLIDQNSCAHWRSPMDMIFQGRSTSAFQA